MADRLTALDTSFLHLEDDAAHMHVASVMLFDGDPTAAQRVHRGNREPAPPRPALPPEARLRAVRPGPAALGRRPAPEPELPRPQDRAARARAPRSSCAPSRAACSRSSSTATSRCGRSGWSRASRAAASPWSARRTTRWWTASPAWTSSPSCSTWPPRAASPKSPSIAGCRRRCLRARSSCPRRCSSAPPCRRRSRARCAPSSALRGSSPTALRDSLVGVGAMAWAGMNPAPPSPYNCRIGPHRRFTWVRTNLDDVKAIKDGLGGTVNDVVLATVSGALGRHLHRRGETLSGRELKAMVPVSVRADEDRGALGNQVAAMMAPLPVWCSDPRAETRDRERGDGGPEGVRAGRRRAGADAHDRIRARRRSWPRHRG